MPDYVFQSPDLNVSPAPPRNVAFAIQPSTDSTRPDVILQARWAVQDCETSSTRFCVETLGYIVACRESDADEEVRIIVWQSDVKHLRGTLASAELSVRPVTTYGCQISAFNGNGVGFAGSKIPITTTEIGMPSAKSRHGCCIQFHIAIPFSKCSLVSQHKNLIKDLLILATRIL